MVFALAALSPNDPAYAQQKAALDRIRMEPAWELSTGGDQRIGVVDTGVVRAHDDLRVSGGWNFLGGADGDDQFEDTTTSSLSHGSHVAGTAAAIGDNGDGIVGVHWNAEVVVARALDGNGAGNNLTIIAAARWLAGLAPRPGTGAAAAPSIAPVDVIIMSLGIPGPCDATMQADIDDIINAGVVVVAASGNHGADFGGSTDDAVTAPANCEGVISVGAFDVNFNRTAYTNAVGRVDLLAPGGTATDAIVSYGAAENALVAQQGTSMAAPHVTGVVALMRDVNPSLSPDEIRDILISLPERNGEVVLDARAALDAASGDDVGGPNGASGGCASTDSAGVSGAVVLLLALRRRRQRRQR